MSKRLMLLACSAVLLFSAPAMAEELYSGSALSPETVGTRITQPEAGTIRVDTASPTAVNLADVDVREKKLEETTLKYSAKLKTEGLDGAAFLEMWVHFSGANKGSYFSRGLDQQVTGDADWTAVSIPFVLKKGQVPERVTLNVQVGGRGAVLIKDIILSD